MVLGTALSALGSSGAQAATAGIEASHQGHQSLLRRLLAKSTPRSRFVVGLHPGSLQPASATCIPDAWDQVLKIEGDERREFFRD